jgi:acetyl-CoA synthetase
MGNNLFEDTDSILSEERIFHPTPAEVANANITAYMKSKGFDNYGDFYKWSIANRFEYWDDMARELHWFEPWQKTFEWTTKPFFQWFVGGKFNIVYNCLDRHMDTPIRHKVAFHWEADNGETRSITYEQLYVETNRFAKGLQNLGLKKGDRVAIYMPAILEQIIAVLAVARLGAVHSVVFGGFAASALRDRIIDAEATMVITADGNHRGGKLIQLKQIADEAVAETPSIQKVVVFQREGLKVEMKEGRDVFWHTLI